MAATNIGETKKKSARCLFGRPDPEQVSRQLNARLDRMYKEDSRKWNFDFSGGVPIVGPGGDYQFESISASDVPHFYHDRTIRSSRKIIRRREYTPVSDTVEAPEELQKQLLLVNEPEQQLLIASTSGHVQSYVKPVTRSSTAKKATEQQEVDTLKQTKLTKPVSKIVPVS
uniref:CDI domain-containing protein n=1 Tax=Caenorhabditis japonica TaxID=281687 RepID=A0A8R1HYF4_CAEJA